MNTIARRQVFLGAETGPHFQAPAPNILVQSNNSQSITVEGSNFPDVSGLWQTVGTHTAGATGTPMVTRFAFLRLVAAGACEVSVSAADGEAGGGGGGGGGGSVTSPGVAGTQAQAVQGVPGGVPVPVVGFQAIPTAPFNRPADTTAYAVGDLVANSTTAGSVAPMQLTAARVAAGSFILRRLRLRKSTASLANASFRVHLFNAAPTVANGDNGALSMTGAASYIGAVDITMTQGFTDGAFGDGGITAPEFNIALASGQAIFALLEARAAYAPGLSETFALTAEVLQN